MSWKAKKWSYTLTGYICTRPYACPFPLCHWCNTPVSTRVEGTRLTQEERGRKPDNMTYYIVPGRMPALFPFVGGIRCIRFHPWFTQRVCAGHKGQRADSQTIWPITICTMHPFPTLVYTEGVRWTQEAKGRKSENMADYIVNSNYC